MNVGESRWQKRERIRGHLLDLVDEYGPGRAIPGERQLSDELSVSRPTLRSVVDDLVRDGLLVREHGRGVFVAKAKVAQRLGAPATPPGRPLAVGGVDGVWTSRMVDFQAVAAGARISRRLNVSPAEPILRITRLRLADGDPMSVDTLHVPAVLVPGLAPQDLETGSFYQILGQRYGIGLATATQIIEPTVVDTAEAELLGVPVHTPALLFERATADTEGRVVEFTHSVYRGDRYRIVTQLSLAADDDGSGGRVVGGSWSTASAVPGADTLVLDSYWSG
ncbi:GntR family transcriptional regulator [Catenulispora rubra]|uniref:GntR family transcriptional regulator n=1 Tax=Catenulispora rubra TaxID=280293 RepID=UPI00189275A1|nr:GntR family transcriptional regulator [Catenulispora rubra]